MNVHTPGSRRRTAVSQGSLSLHPFTPELKRDTSHSLHFVWDNTVAWPSAGGSGLWAGAPGYNLNQAQYLVSRLTSIHRLIVPSSLCNSCLLQRPPSHAKPSPDLLSQACNNKLPFLN
ncbi:hypothetical protein WMY93_003765 [Mugilogobius chulae]|uniref:Uncharacterized protein n=1 Tax=Mugilogobius chulae TaxID=88201 RepID=A0AAW0Q8F8_9GOBI